MERRARLLASFVQGTLEAVERYDAELGARVRAALGPETREAIESASRVSLVPVELDVELTERLYDLAGAERARAILRANLAATFDSPVLRSFVQMAMRMGTSDPAGMFRWASKVWNHLYRDCGEMSFVRTGDGEGRAELHDLPDVIAAHPRYLDGAAATLAAAFDIVKVVGDGELSSVDRERRSAVLTLRWEPTS